MTEPVSPRVKRSFSIIGHDPDTVELRHGVWSSTSHTITDESRRGWLFSAVDALDGSRSLAAVAEKTNIGMAELSSLIDHLRGLGAIEDGASSALDHYLDRYADLLTGPPPVARPVRVIGDSALAAQVSELIAISDPELDVADASGDTALRVLDDPDTGWTVHGLRLHEVADTFSSWEQAIVVWAGLRVDPVAAGLFNRIALEAGMSWLHGAIDGPFLFVGPTFHPGRGPCYACLEKRVTMNLTDGDGYRRYKNALASAEASGGRSPVLPALSSLLCSYLALEAINLARTGASFTNGKMLGFHLPTWETTVNEILQIPGCHACSPIAQRDEPELYFQAKEWLHG
ncbi:TOMM precursor leader peptide-binding protein [Nonomuraea guangzhouensis]|uniref:TOMM leader peptide-binding protein n=1 Tax=Nonomuraea guangzhouensis TaxID=1291555 RepID=A0ABW4GTF2_9ACTN|nr:TOMM precursor leader peptide-binding protein [Nonomuraea guangzhouensis]